MILCGPIISSGKCIFYIIINVFQLEIFQSAVQRLPVTRSRQGFFLVHGDKRFVISSVIQIKCGDKIFRSHMELFSLNTLP